MTSKKIKVLDKVSEAIQSFEEEKIFSIVKKSLEMGIDPSEIIEKGIAKGLKIVGEKFERGEYFLTELVSAAEPAQKAVKELLEPELKKKAGTKKSMGKIVLGTVEGDIHSIGKNIVAAMFFASGFEVIDLGEDVPVEKFINTAKEVDADLVGASALLTTTLLGQRKIIEALKAEGIRDRIKVIFGGAPCTPEWVKEIGGDIFQLLLAPIYLGYQGGNDGWFREVLTLGPEKCQEYGRFLGKHYADNDNIIWLMGGDRNPGPALNHVNMVALGIKEYDKRHLFTAHCAPETSAADGYSGCEWLDFNTVYSYQIVYYKVIIEYTRLPIMPVMLIESTYEGEHSATQVQIRRQAYWAILRGGFGHVFGNRPIWLFDSGWQAAMDAPGSISMMYWRMLFNSRKWCELIPDQMHKAITKGLGEFLSLDFLTAGQTEDGSTVIAYMPTSRTITVNMSMISGSKANAWWFDPQTGKTTFIGEFPTNGSKDFTPPREGDWVLVLDDTSKSYPPPGT